MAKALLGHVGNVDYRMVAEVRRLQQRVHDLETEVHQLQVENDALASSVNHDDLIRLSSEKQPALA
jgi:hypothetical protein